MHAERSWLALLLGLLAAPGCKSADEDLLVGSDQLDDAGATPLADAAANAASCQEGSLRSCPCGDAGAVGAETCIGGSFGMCRGCPAPDQRSLCAPGYYVGVTKGTYVSSAGLLPGVIALPRVDNSSNWQFTLAQQGSAEFSTLGSGCVHVVESGTDPVTSDGRSRALLTGDVNCATGVLTGEVRGYYTGPDAGFLTERKYYYKGTIRATYDPERKAFVDGSYKTSEPNTVLGEELGGIGTFTLSASDQKPLPDTGECLIGGFPEEMFK